MATPSAHGAAVRTVYREIYHILRQNSNQSCLKELREGFRHPLADGETVETRLKAAENRLSFLRISTVKSKQRGGKSGSQRFVYKNGERLAVSDGGVTLRDGNGKVVSNWDGNNLDPESVSRHRQQLHRAGFVNNAHAKGIF